MQFMFRGNFSAVKRSAFRALSVSDASSHFKKSSIDDSAECRAQSRAARPSFRPSAGPSDLDFRLHLSDLIVGFSFILLGCICVCLSVCLFQCNNSDERFCLTFASSFDTTFCVSLLLCCFVSLYFFVALPLCVCLLLSRFVALCLFDSLSLC